MLHTGDWDYETMTALDAQRFLQDAMDYMLKWMTYTVIEDISYPDQDDYEVDPEMEPAYDILEQKRNLLRQRQTQDYVAQ